MTDDMKAPVMWRKPRSKVYDYNQEFGDNYYKPMISYLNDKELQGCFFEKPREKIHLPDPTEVICDMHNREPKSEMTSGVRNVDQFLVKAYSKQIKEINTSTVRSKNEMIRNSKTNTTLTPKLTSTLLRNHYVKQLEDMRKSSMRW
jgi:hypothetical protein